MGHRKGDQQHPHAQHQPGFVCVPKRSDARDHGVLLGVGRLQEQQANAQVVTIQNHISQQGQPHHDQEKQWYEFSPGHGRLSVSDSQRQASSNPRFAQQGTRRRILSVFLGVLGHVLQHANISHQQQAINHQVSRQGERNVGRRQGGGGFAGAHQAIHQEGLATDLGHVPARQRGDPAGERHAREHPQQGLGQCHFWLPALTPQAPGGETGD